MMGAMCGWGMCGWGMMLGMLLFWAVVIAVVAAGVWWLLSRRRPGARDAALELRERYARGDISREEFKSRRRDLAA